MSHKQPPQEFDDGKPQSGGGMKRRELLLSGSSLVAASALLAAGAGVTAKAQQAASNGGKPNILIIWGDDIGIANLSAYSNGLMGYETPNIDRIGREGVMAFRPSKSSAPPAR